MEVDTSRSHRAYAWDPAKSILYSSFPKLIENLLIKAIFFTNWTKVIFDNMRLSLLEVPQKLKNPLLTRISRLPAFGSYKNNVVITYTYNDCDFITILLVFYFCQPIFFVNFYCFWCTPHETRTNSLHGTEFSSLFSKKARILAFFFTIKIRISDKCRNSKHKISQTGYTSWHNLFCSTFSQEQCVPVI